MKGVNVPNEVIVIDLEATCWLTQPRSTNRDIIEIGTCILNTHSGEISRKTSILVRPTHSRIGFYCWFVTGITPERAKQGISFGQACEQLKTDYDASIPWASWGSWDCVQMMTQCAREQVSHPLSFYHIDIKLLVAERLGWRRPKSLPRALAALDMQFEGQKHHALDDAVNEARLFHKALQER